MTDLILAWSDAVYDLQELLAERAQPVYIVGGAVRDALLRRPVKDIDIAVPEGGIALARRIANGMGGAFYVLDAERDVARALIDTPDGRLAVDVSGFRGGTLDADLFDRDFTINAMAVDLRDVNVVIDPTGGAKDAIDKLIRRCNPDAIVHDPIRALRAVRQSVQFGFRIEPATQDDIRANAPRLLDTSMERVRDELFKLLAVDKPVTALRVADRLDLLTRIIPELEPLHGLQQHRDHAYDGWNHTLAVVDSLHDILTVISPRRTDSTAAQFNLGMVAVALDRFREPLQVHFGGVGPDDRSHRALLLLAALLHDIGKPMVASVQDENRQPRFRRHESVGADAAAERCEALRLSRAEIDCVVTLVRYHMGSALWADDLTPLVIYRFWKLLGETGIDLIVLTLADYLGAVGSRLDQDRWLVLVERAQALLNAYYNERDRLIDPPPLVNGSQLMRALGLSPGPAVGDLLERIREGQVTGEIVSTDDALRFARQHVGRRNGHHAE
ncbi:MAG: HD domain-containing protein [Anaerolineae bacterium]|nr:HD domain-containing protein [Anaerolineae bacterium]